MEGYAFDMNNLKPEDINMLAMVNEVYSSIITSIIEDMHRSGLIDSKTCLFNVSRNTQDYLIEIAHVKTNYEDDRIQITLLEKRTMN